MKISIKVFLLLAVLAATVIFYLPVSAQNIDLGWGKVQEAASVTDYHTSQDSKTALAMQIGGVVRVALMSVGAIFFILVVYAGYLWMTARGEEEPVKKAQKIIVAAVIGLLIAGGSYVITNIITERVLQKTTGAAQEAGGGKVYCCDTCGKWKLKCPDGSKQQMNEEACKQADGSYMGLVSAGECK